ncbi:hypothetical protein V1525DRAFT_401628 [Lipomyces kononenkoae]|uniref:Uncharacterized protein n=1 Tax=Lipomyces kononenkoae TaxID=34357 RepID=A0ACC3T332_LIPKO
MILYGCAGCSSTKWICFTSTFLATALMAFATASVMISRSLCHISRGETVPPGNTAPIEIVIPFPLQILHVLGWFLIT